MSLTPEQIAQLRANDHADLRPGLIAGHSILLTIAVISVGLRFWVRRLVKTHWGADDYCNLAGMLCAAVYTALNYIMIDHYSMGRHIWWEDNPVAYVKLSLAAECMYTACIPFIKCSILLLYHRIFPQKWFHHALLGLGLFVISYSLAQLFTDIFQCIPVSSIWGATAKQYCINFTILIKVMGIINILTDVAIIALPIPSIWSLNLSPTRKRLLLVLFMVGGLATVGAILRLFFVNRIGNSTDATWDYAVPAVIANVELCVGVLASNLITYRPFITRFFAKRRATDTIRTSKAGVYLPVKDSIRMPMRSHFSGRNESNSELDDDMEMLAGKSNHQMQTQISNDTAAWPGLRNNEIRVTTSFKTT